MTANLHAIWLDDLAPGEGSTPIWDALYAEQDAETQRVVFNACADEHTEPVAVAPKLWEWPFDLEADLQASVDAITDKITTAVRLAEQDDAKVTPIPKPKKKPTPRKPAAKSPLAAQEAKLRTVRGRLADEFKTLGGGA